MSEQSNTINQPLLIEIGCEELPPAQVPALGRRLFIKIKAALHDKGFHSATIDPIRENWQTPRRLVIFIDKITPLHHPNITITDVIPGPQVKDAYNTDGTPNKNAKGFARAHGVSVDDLRSKGGRLVVLRPQVSPDPISLAQCLPDIIQQALQAATKNISKTMYWGDNNQFQFVRPLRWLCILHGDQVIDAELYGVRAGRSSYGHRRAGNPTIELERADHYQEELERESNGGIIIDFKQRQEIIQRQLNEVLKTIPAAAAVSNDEQTRQQLTTIAAMSESPYALLVPFERSFLSLPQDIIVTVLKDGLNALTVHDRQGHLLPYFISILDGRVQHQEPVRRAYQRVVHARLNDAQFFFKRDRQKSLLAHGAGLDGLILQKQLGHYADKTKRLQKLMCELAPLFRINREHAERSAQLCKCDLLTEMVGEFPTLQGLVGSFYARHDGEKEAVVNAIGEHYRPLYTTDALPASSAGLALSLADKTDTLVGLLGIGYELSSSRDPYGLRRAATGIVRILFEHEIELGVKSLLQQAQQNYGQAIEACTDRAFAYLVERLQYCLMAGEKAAQYCYDFSVVEAVMRVHKSDHWGGLKRKLHAVQEFVVHPEAPELILANKRIANILQHHLGQEIHEQELRLPAERDLYTAYQQCAPQIRQLNERQEYRPALQKLAQLHILVNRFFDEVMVMSERPTERNNRLALLAAIRNLFLHIADFSCIAVDVKRNSSSMKKAAETKHSPTQ